MEGFPHLCFHQHWEITDTVQYQLGECHALVEAIARTPLRPKARQSLMSMSFIKGAQATAAIEGNTLTQEEVERIYEGKENLPPSREYLQIEVKNVLDAFNYLHEEVIFNDVEWLITPDRLLDFHKRITQNLGQHADAIPGRFREDNRQVGPYLAPDHTHVQELVAQLCEWIRREFHFGRGQQEFTTSIIQAIVTHVYIEWIHPFGDGNGRTGRLVEFYILLRAGLPDIASHILSNFYNQTRPEYYRQLNECRKTRDLTNFIQYAIQGFRDGLIETLDAIQEMQFKIFWRDHIYTTFSDIDYKKREVFKRKRNLMMAIPLNGWKTQEEILQNVDQHLAFEYMQYKPLTLKRDLDELVQLELLVKEKNKYRPNIDILLASLPLSK